MNHDHSEPNAAPTSFWRSRYAIGVVTDPARATPAQIESAITPLCYPAKARPTRLDAPPPS